MLFDRAEMELGSEMDWLSNGAVGSRPMESVQWMAEMMCRKKIPDAV